MIALRDGRRLGSRSACHPCLASHTVRLRRRTGHPVCASGNSLTLAGPTAEYDWVSNRQPAYIQYGRAVCHPPGGSVRAPVSTAFVVVLGGDLLELL